jgi:hypothetical protein
MTCVGKNMGAVDLGIWAWHSWTFQPQRLLWDVRSLMHSKFIYSCLGGWIFHKNQHIVVIRQVPSGVFWRTVASSRIFPSHGSIYKMFKMCKARRIQDSPFTGFLNSRRLHAEKIVWIHNMGFCRRIFRIQRFGRLSNLNPWTRDDLFANSKKSKNRFQSKALEKYTRRLLNDVLHIICIHIYTNTCVYIYTLYLYLYIYTCISNWLTGFSLWLWDRTL